MSLTPAKADIENIRSLPEALFRTHATAATRPAQWQRKGGEYTPITYEQLVSRVRQVACGLIRAHVKPGDRIAILMENRPEWAVVDYAALSVGAVTVPLYCSYRLQDITYVLQNSGATTVFTSGGALLRNLQEAVAECPSIKQIYAIDSCSDAELVTPLSELYDNEADEGELERRLKKIDRDQLATIVYTSGTTNFPKGVMLSHGNILTNLEGVPAVVDLSQDEKLLSFLPLAHTLERTGGHFLAYSYGLSVAFAERPDTVAKNLSEARPTIMIVVPRMLEVMHSRILAQAAQQSVIKRVLFQNYLNLAEKPASGAVGTFTLKLLDQLVGQKIRNRLGGQLQLLVSGGAPLNLKVAEFFEALSMPIIEGYGLTECAPLLSANPMEGRRHGTVGLPAKGVDIKIAEDGEIVARGNNIMAGYWNNRKATKEVLIDGWFHTGDLGELDKDGYLKITGRKKDIIVNSGGENIAPQRIEMFLTESEEMEQVVVYGDRKPYLVALVIPNQEKCTAWAEEQGLPKTDWGQLCDSPILRKHLQTKINSMLKPFSPFEQVRRIHLLHQPFTIESELMTPTLKVKRNKVYEKYADVLSSLYS